MITEAQALYEVDLEKIRTRVDNFFTEIKLDFSVLSISNGNASASASAVDENSRNELNSLSENLKENLDKITKLVKTVKNELFLVLKNKVESLNKEAANKLDAYKFEITQSFNNNLNLINEKISKIKILNLENYANLNKITEEKEFERLNKEIENYIQNLIQAEKAKAELESKNKELETIQINLQTQNENYLSKLNEFENALKEKESQINVYIVKLNESHLENQEMQTKLINLNNLNEENRKIIANKESEGNENKQKIENLNFLLANVHKGKTEYNNNKINELQNALQTLQNNFICVVNNNTNEVNFQVDELEKDKKDLEVKLASTEYCKSESSIKCFDLGKELEEFKNKIYDFVSSQKVMEDRNAELQNSLISLAHNYKRDNEQLLVTTTNENNNQNQETNCKIKELLNRINVLENAKAELLAQKKENIEIEFLKQEQEHNKVKSELEAEKQKLSLALKVSEALNNDLNKKIEELDKITANVTVNNNNTPNLLSSSNTTSKGKGKKKKKNNSEINIIKNNSSNISNGYDEADRNAQENVNRANDEKNKIAGISSKLDESQSRNEIKLKEISKFEESLKNQFANSEQRSLKPETNLSTEIIQIDYEAIYIQSKEKQEELSLLLALTANLQSEINSLKSVLGEKDEKKSAENKDEKEKHENEIRLLSDKIDELIKLNNKMKQVQENEIKQVKTNEENLNKEINTLKLQLDAAMDNNINLEADKQNKQIEEKLKCEINDLKVLFEKLNSENAQLKDSIDDNQISQNYELTTLKANAEKLKEENFDFKYKLEQTEKELISLKHNSSQQQEQQKNQKSESEN